MKFINALPDIKAVLVAILSGILSGSEDGI